MLKVICWSEKLSSLKAAKSLHANNRQRALPLSVHLTLLPNHLAVFISACFNIYKL